MQTKPTLITALAFGLAAIAANASPLTYVISNNDTDGSHHFGTVDLATGAFHQIGPNAPVGSEGLAPGANGSLLTVAYNGDVYSIDPATGAYSVLRRAVFGDCLTLDSPCGPTSNLTLGSANGKVYATDFQNRIYGVDPLTGAATLIGTTGIPAIPFIPASQDDQNTINFYEEALFGAGGKLYATFDAFVFDFTTLSPVSVAVAPKLYEINPSTGVATVVSSTDLAIGAVVGVNGTNYAFNLLKSQISSHDLASGNTTLLTNTDPTAGVIRGATATPEPASIALTGIGIAATLVWRRRKLYLRA